MLKHFQPELTKVNFYFSLFSSFQIQLAGIKNCQFLDSNRGSQVPDATALVTAPEPIA